MLISHKITFDTGQNQVKNKMNKAVTASLWAYQADTYAGATFELGLSIRGLEEGGTGCQCALTWISLPQPRWQSLSASDIFAAAT